MGGKSDAPDETNSVQQVQPWSGVQPYLTNMFSNASNLYQQGGPQYYPGQTYPGRDPLQDQAQNLNLNYAMNSMPGQIYDTQRAQSYALNSPDAANNPYVQNMMQSNQFNLNRNLQENLLPSIRGGALNAGGVGGSRQGIAEGIALRGTQDALANANAQTMMGAYGQGLTAQGRALAMAPQTMSMGMAPMDVMNQVGQYNQGIDQQALGADMDRWNYNQQLPWNTIGQYNSLLSGTPWGSSTTSTAEGGGGSPIAGALGGGLAGAALGSSMTTALPSWLGGATGATGLGFTGWGAPLAIGGALLGGLFG